MVFSQSCVISLEGVAYLVTTRKQIQKSGLGIRYLQIRYFQVTYSLPAWAWGRPHLQFITSPYYKITNL